MSIALIYGPDLPILSLLLLKFSNDLYAVVTPVKFLTVRTRHFTYKEWNDHPSLRIPFVRKKFNKGQLLRRTDPGGDVSDH